MHKAGDRMKKSADRPRIAVVGSNVIDLITYADRMPSNGETVAARDFSMGFGGKGANQAAAAAMLGAVVGMVSKVGEDMFGEQTLANFTALGIDTSHVTRTDGRATGTASIFVGSDSNNRILIFKGANELLSNEDIDRAEQLLRSSDLVVLQLEIALSGVYHTIELCRTWGVPVLLNPAPADSALDLSRVNGVDFFVPNETELQALTGAAVENEDDALKAARLLTDKGFRHVIVTLGEKGALYVNSDQSQLVPPLTVKTRDTTGAGDAFIGCFAVQYCLTGDIVASIRYANRYAALSTTRAGTQKSFATLEEFRLNAENSPKQEKRSRC
jgi:ribokinase